MSNTGFGTRIATLFLALLFLASSAGVSVGIFYLVRREQRQTEKTQAANAELQKAIEQARVDGTTASPTPAANDTTKQGDETVNPSQSKLEGTKLANFAPGSPVSELQTIDLVVGTGAEATQSSTVTAHYTGALVSDGTIFQSSKDTGSPFTSSLSRLIQGWQEGIPGMKAGGTRRLIIPAAKAYGAQSQPGIPANSDLVFDIELISVQ